MIGILGIDAAWTDHEPSGVALVARTDTAPWRCVCVAPSYSAFLRASQGETISWQSVDCDGEAPDVRSILAAASRLIDGHVVDVVAIDMPVSRANITGRRTADDLVSEEFGAAGCGTHSPSEDRPGDLGATLTVAFGDCGYPVATQHDKSGTLARLVEVYPHPALLTLLNKTYRLPYKAGKTKKYWPKDGVHERIEKLSNIYRQILTALKAEIDGIDLPLPNATSCTSLASLKRYEDSLDALVCAWAGCRYVDGSSTAYGDADAAIWVPDARTKSS